MLFRKEKGIPRDTRFGADFRFFENEADHLSLEIGNAIVACKTISFQQIDDFKVSFEK